LNKDYTRSLCRVLEINPSEHLKNASGRGITATSFDILAWEELAK